MIKNKEIKWLEYVFVVPDLWSLIDGTFWRGRLVLDARRPRDDDNCEAHDSHNQAKNHQKNSLETRKQHNKQKRNLFLSF